MNEELLEYLEYEKRYLEGWEALTLLARIKGFVKSQQEQYSVGNAKQYGEE